MIIYVHFHMLVLKMETFFLCLFRAGSKFNPLGYYPCLSPQLALTLTSLADSFEHFHTSGLEHYKAAIQLVQGLQEIAAQYDGNTIAGPLQQVWYGAHIIV